jgi:uncharacterized protein YcaQ
MWVWSAAKHALEWLFWAGLVAATHRRDSFERVEEGTIIPVRVRGWQHQAYLHKGALAIRDRIL